MPSISPSSHTSRTTHQPSTSSSLSLSNALGTEIVERVLCLGTCIALYHLQQCRDDVFMRPLCDLGVCGV